ncbi:glycosyltransferase family 1 protein [Aaosphaeria arxii CBS 175.79]|uniref:Glycosyltransferase family 1 protein n=1 Tax=Aaosphaeria arxii CBS 175.79 TaxID=1450172 RepID=A0A6A5X8K0_9PLEO|nr:glycosyltransferase family 1 protein [Aaosphaeria arxii CBS 175.79]KAF2009278.1 glycosyltransferase family 1 protein [Aaosphaeria arxii CBS 175.79]
MAPKSVTDRPQPTTRSSLLGRKRTESTGRRPPAQRQTTLTFDPYSSDSSSSSDEDESKHTRGLDSRQETQFSDRVSKRSHRGLEGPFSKFRLTNEGFDSTGKVSKRDGRLKLNITESVNSGYFAKTLGAGLKKHLIGADNVESATSSVNESIKTSSGGDPMEDTKRRVKLNIVIIVIGSRGDIQPFLKIGKILKEDYGHRVRIATHPAFKNFVEGDSGLEFFSVGGDPSELMAFMVKNPGLIPSLDTIKEGEIGRRRAAMYDMFQGMWRACINSTDDEGDKANLKMMGNKHPFIADAIIANPPSFAPPHIAERLGIPLHMMFTFPYSPTVKFPHPLANVKKSNVDSQYTNFMSYPLVEMMTWQGLGDLINRFRAKTLMLEEVSTLWAPGQLFRLRVPYTYMWSPGLVPKPHDWGSEIEIAGFVFLDLASSFKPPEDLVKFLEAGEKPVYIGFGSIVVDDPDRFTKLIFEAVRLAGVRALVSKGWGGFGSNDNCPDNIFMLDNTPHDWLFPKVSAVVHHGGAGTTAIGLKCGKPTMIVPFFGDQPFWGAMVSKAKAGAHDCIPYKKLTAEKLAEGIKQCLTDEARENVGKIAESIAKEGDGALNAVRSFHRSLRLEGERNMRCQILDDRVATWKLKGTSLQICPLAAELLVEWKKIKWNELRLLRHNEWNDYGGPGEPLTGGWGVIVDTIEDVFTGVGLVPVKMAKSVRKREQYYEKRWKLKQSENHKKELLKKADNAVISNNGSEENEGTGNRPGADRKESTLSNAVEPENWLAEELAQEAGHGVRKTGSAIIKSPMNFTLAVTKGFHNAPRLYGDETVRRPPRVTGFHSGIRAGRDEFVYGIHDGVTGLWRQPIAGAKDGGLLGCLRGMSMGVGGFVLKDIAAILGPGAYTMKGLDEEGRKKYQPTTFIRKARIIQGQKELSELGPRRSRKKNSDVTGEDPDISRRQKIELQVAERWESMQSQISEEKKIHKSGIRAALLGTSQRKEGNPVPRKTFGRKPATSAVPKAQPKKHHSEPVNQAEQVLSEPALGLKRGETAPDTSMTWEEKNEKKRTKKQHFDNVAGPIKEEAKEGGITKHLVPNAFDASRENNEDLNESTRRASVSSNTLLYTSEQEFESGKVANDEEVGFSRSKSDTADWAVIQNDTVGADHLRARGVTT